MCAHPNGIAHLAPSTAQARDVAVFTRVLQPKRAPAAAGDAGIQGTLATPKTGWWKSLDAWLVPRLTIVPTGGMGDSSDGALNGDRDRHRSGRSEARSTSTDTHRGSVGLSGHRPPTGGLLAVGEGAWNTDPVLEIAREGEISLADQSPGLEMTSTRQPPSPFESSPVGHRADPGHAGYAAALLE